MTNTNLLRKRVKESGLKYGYIAAQLGLSYNSLSRKINNSGEFKASEIKAFSQLLGIKSFKEREDIFFAEDVN